MATYFDKEGTRQQLEDVRSRKKSSDHAKWWESKQTLIVLLGHQFPSLRSRAEYHDICNAQQAQIMINYSMPYVPSH
jgi:hypothetical protein